MIELLDDPRAFAAAAQGLLVSTVRNTVPATVVEGLLSGRFPDTGWCFALVRDGAGTVRAAALRTPPRALLCTALEPAAAAPLIGAWLQRDPELPAVHAEAATARALAAAYRMHTGGSSERTTSMALHALTPEGLRDPPRPAAGVLREPHAHEQERMVAWYLAFGAEAGVPEAPDAARRSVLSRLDRGLLSVWEDGGEPVCLLGRTVAVAGVPRIGPVYTPPPLRGRGYASSAVAALARRLFTDGAEGIVLFTDLANPTPNRIYGEIGFRRLADYEEYTLHR